MRRLCATALGIILGCLFSPAAANAQPVLLVSTFANDTIARFDLAGQESPFASGLNDATGLAIDSARNVYEADNGGNGIWRFSQSGQDLGFFAGPGGPFVNPTSVAFDSSGILYVANGGNTFGNNQILRFAPNGQQLSGVPLPNVTSLSGLAFDSAGNLYASDRNSNSIHKFLPTGQSLGEFATGLQDPTGLAFDALGKLYVSNYSGDNIGVYSSSGQLLNTLTSGVNGPVGLAFGPDNNLYLANLDGNSIHRFSATEVDLGDFAAGINTPWGLAFNTITVPEPGSLLLVAVGLSTVQRWRNRSRRKDAAIEDRPPGEAHYFEVKNHRFDEDELRRFADLLRAERVVIAMYVDGPREELENLLLITQDDTIVLLLPRPRVPAPGGP